MPCVLIRVSFAMAVPMLVFSCRTVEFYGQAVRGQYEILSKSRPIPKVLEDPATSPALRDKLLAVENIRRFAREHLSLPGNESYGKYADLGREHVVWVLYATPEFSLKPKTWFYPLVGRMDYRGYFREQDAASLADRLRREGYDVHLGGVDAYSTLGWFHDPILNTFVGYPDVDLAETIFHELTHRRVFRHGDTDFNECLANVVAEEGVRRWLKYEGRLANLRKYEGRLVKRREFHREIEVARHRLEALYASDLPDVKKRSMKAATLAKLRGQFRDLRRRWGGRGLEGWLREDINNSHIASLQIYADKMPQLRALLAECGGDIDLFFTRAAKIRLP